MGEAWYLVGGGATNIRAVGEEAARLHQSFLGALEFPERLFPQLAGRKMFWVEYSDVEAQDVETIRQDLCRNLNTRAWSITRNADGTHNFHPSPFGPDHIPANNGGNHRPPRNREASRDPYEDEDDDEDWDWDWGYPAPPPNRNRRRNTYANDYDFSDGGEDEFEPRPYRNRRRNPFANDFDFSDGDEDDFEPIPHRGRRRNPYASIYDARESPPDYLEPSRHRGPLRGTYAREIYRGSWNGEDPERPQFRIPSYGNRRDRDENPEPIGPYSYPSNRHGRDRYRGAHAPVGPVDPERRRQRARPQPRMMCRLLRSFLNFTLSGT